MTTTEELMGGPWLQHARHLHVESDGWIRGHYVPTAIHSVQNYARLADTVNSDSSLEQLDRALRNLENEIDTYQRRLCAFRDQVSHLRSEVLRAREELIFQAEKPSDWSVIAPDEDEETWIERNRNLYR